MLAATNISEYTQFAKFAKYNSTPKFVDLQYLGDKQTEQNRKSTKFYWCRESSPLYKGEVQLAGVVVNFSAKVFERERCKWKDEKISDDACGTRPLLRWDKYLLFFLSIRINRGEKVSRLTHTYPYKTPN